MRVAWCSGYSCGVLTQTRTTGPQNVFFGNVMQKAWNVSEPIADYEPYYKTDGSLSNTIFEFGWTGSAYEHLSLDGETPVLDWMHNERAEWKAGLVKSKTDSAKSLFVKVRLRWDSTTT